MLNHEERVRLKKLLSEAVPLLCKNSLGRHVDEKFCVEAMIGITMDEQQVYVVPVYTLVIPYDAYIFV